jgi:hypothetical protein
MPNHDMWHELEKDIDKAIKEINNENRLLVTLIAVLNQLNTMGKGTRVHRNEHGEMYIVVGDEYRIANDPDSGEWYTTDSWP